MVWLLLLIIASVTFWTLRKYLFRSPSKYLLAFLGSGGHTGEMLSMLSSYQSQTKGLVWTYAYSSDDSLSPKRVPNDSIVYCVPRARRVGQSFLTTIPAAIKALICCFWLVFTLNPRLVLGNGPGTCLLIIVAAKILRITGFVRTRIIYVESMARVNKLSLTGRLIYKLKLADRFVVQWPELKSQYPGTEYMGLLV